MLQNLLGRACVFNPLRHVRALPQASTDIIHTNNPDKLYKSIELEVRGHDKEVLLSYTTFLKNVCRQLEIESSKVRHLRYHKWIQNLLRSKFAHKKYQLHYEIRTHIKQMTVFNLTGSTSSAFLEYIERNIPEGVAMKVNYTEVTALPDSVKSSY